MENVEVRVRELIKEDESLTNAHDCRNAVDKLAKQLQEQFPHIKINLLAYPQARAGFGVHYALSVDDDGDEILINPVKDRRFPQYIGPRSKAVPTFSEMKVVQEVI